MKKVSFSAVLFFAVLHTAAQQIQFASDVRKLINKIDESSSLIVYNVIFNHCDSFCLHEPARAFSYFVDSVDGQLQKVFANEISTKAVRTYYFNDERLIGVKECSDPPNSITRTSYFSDGFLSIGTTYKDNSDHESLLRRKSLLADAYLILLHHKSLGKKVEKHTK
jgi:hypothetical protein